jgi:hypothetical protein
MCQNGLWETKKNMRHDRLSQSQDLNPVHTENEEGVPPRRPLLVTKTALSCVSCQLHCVDGLPIPSDSR